MNLHECPHCKALFNDEEVESGEYRKHLAAHREDRNKSIDKLAEHAQHTPGQWTVTERGGMVEGAPGGIYIENADYKIMARVGHFTESREERRKVARLIAAAPELLGACKTVLPFLKDCIERPRHSAQMQRIGSDAEDSMRVVSEAIAKAEGR